MHNNDGCCCGSDELEQNKDRTCDCESGNEKDCCDVADDCECGCGCDHSEQGEGLITMTDTETGESYTFAIADDFSYEEDHYCVLVTVDDERDPEMIIAKVVKMDDDSEGLMSLDDTEYDRVYAEYERLCEDEADEGEDEETAD